MILTLYYMAATWLQSWRLRAMQTKIMLMLSRNESLVLYNEPSSVLADSEGEMGMQLPSLSSKWCVNKNDARVGDMVWFEENKRGCSLYPLQRLDITHWIGFHNEKSQFPFELGGPSKTVLCEAPRLHVLVEAEFGGPLPCDAGCQVRLEEFGVPLAWRTEELMGVVIETDVDNFAKLGTCFMNSRLRMDDGMELVRIETVTVEGAPCRLHNADSIPIVRRHWAMTPDRWRTHVELLAGLSAAASRAVDDADSAVVPGCDWAVVTADRNAFELESPKLAESDVSAPVPCAIPCAVPDAVPATPAPGPQRANNGSPESVYSLSQEAVSSASQEAGSAAGSTPRLMPDDGRSSADSFCSLDSASTVSAASRLVHPLPQQMAAVAEASAILERQPALPPAKPFNVLVYSESSAAMENVKAVLQQTLHPHKHTVYGLSGEQLLGSPWADGARLLVVWGSVADRLAPALVDFLLGGGLLLCLCSDLLLRILPSFQTAEWSAAASYSCLDFLQRVGFLRQVREKELVRFSYSKWKRVPLMHHVFCYQASPSHTTFTDDKSLPVPTSVDMVDGEGVTRTLEVKVLGCEETWHTPSLLLATVKGSPGRAVFSQIHLEQDPAQYEEDEGKRRALVDSDAARLDILRDLLATHLGLECADRTTNVAQYTPAYFLGLFESKQDFLGKLQDRLQPGSVLKLPNLSLQLCGKGVQPAKATSLLMPVLLHSCPEHFSTVEYFESLGSTSVGRLVVYSEVMTSSMSVLEGVPLRHGLAVVPVQQTKGVGRGGNIWLSPPGCAMFSLQLHVPLASHLGQHIPLLQHICGLAVVTSVRNQPGYEALDLRLKWPNDIYVGSTVKIGGLVVNSSLDAKTAVCNIGCGVNLNNGSPTTCINALVERLNKSKGGSAKAALPPISYERFLALAFTEVERLVDRVQAGYVDQVVQLYYKYWLHSNASVTVTTPRGASKNVTVVGIDEFGFLSVRGTDGKTFSVQPDGNSFDMLRGLIAPKNN